MTKIHLPKKWISLFFVTLFLIGCGGSEDSKISDEATKAAKAMEGALSTIVVEDNATTNTQIENAVSADQTNKDAENIDQQASDQETIYQQNRDQDPFSWDTVSGWHTQGIVSKNSPIQINFNRDVIDDSLVGKDASKVMFISPAIKGKPIFETKSRIIWQPLEPLAPGTNYKVSIKPLDLKDIPKNVAPFRFAFNVIPLEYQIKTFGLYSVSNSPDEMMLKGQLLVSDSIADEAAQTILTAKLQSQALPVEWLHDSNGKEHNFIIRDIKRDSFESTLKLSWNGEKINIKTKGQKDIAIPSMNTFNITNISVIHEAKSIPFVEVRFSDELDRSQNLRGLVELAKNKYSTRVSGNVINIYPKRNITGNYTVRLHKGIKAKDGNKVLSEKIERSVSFDDAKPQVKFVGKGIFYRLMEF